MELALTSANNHITAAPFTYDGDGHRVQKSNGKLYWYAGGGDVIEESDASGNMQQSYVFLDGKRIANRVVSSGAISFYAEDFIGSSRVITTSAGATCYDADFYPYGAESNVTNTCAQNYKWTGKERDAETDNDDFDARYYSSTYGRFLSADWSAVPAPVPYANLTNPQTLNLYAIVRDNPESYADLDGHADDESVLEQILGSIYIKLSAGVGTGGNAKAFGVKIEAEAAMKFEGKISLNGRNDASEVKEAQLTAGVKVPAGPEISVGPKISQEMPLQVNGENVPENQQKFGPTEKSLALKIGSNESSISKNDVGIVGAGACVVLCIGVEAGVDFSRVKNPGPPPTPTPPAPPQPPVQLWCGQRGTPCQSSLPSK